jgi:hypothetical protein
MGRLGLRAGAVVVASTLCLVLQAAGSATTGSYTEIAKLTAADQVPISGLGQAVAVSADGNTALVGAPEDEGKLGAVWAFSRTGGHWTETQKLVPPDGLGPGGFFGSSIALSADGTTALISGPEDDSLAGAVWVYTLVAGTWQEQQKLVAAGTIEFGGLVTSSLELSSLALSADGNTALIGGRLAGTANGPAAHGLAWIFVRSGGTWTEQQQLIPADAVSSVGQTVALSADGDTALLGSPGAAWVFTRSGSTWSQQQKIAPPPDATTGGGFGSNVALAPAGDVALIGASGDSNGLGAAFEYTLSGGTWSEAQKLGPPGDASTSSNFGRSLSLSADGSTLLVGGNANAWVYAISGGTWSEQQKLTVADGSFGGTTTFGFDLALSGDGSTAVIGGASDSAWRGAAWVFARSGSNWSEQAKLPLPGDAAGDATLGSSVAVSADGTTAIVGGPLDGQSGIAGRPTGVGAVWVFVRSASGWTEQAKLVPSDAIDPGTGVGFGSSLALSSDGNTAFVGGALDSGAGAVWVYSRSGSTWAEQQKITPPADVTGSSPSFGDAVAASADGATLLIGGSGDNSGKGAVWAYASTGSVWTEQAKLPLPSDGAGTGRFGSAIALSADGHTAIVGASTTTTSSVGPGAWLFTRSSGVWSEAQHLTTPPDTIGPNVAFGTTVAISADGSTVAVANPNDDSIGAVWLYLLSGVTWVERQKVAPADAGVGDGSFGEELSLSGDGSTLAASGVYLSSPGAVWLYAGTGGSWSELQKLAAPPDAESGIPQFGSAIAFTPDAGTLVVGGRLNQNPDGKGAAWIFTTGSASAPPPLNPVTPTAPVSGSGGGGSPGGGGSSGGSGATTITTTGAPTVAATQPASAGSILPLTPPSRPASVSSTGYVALTVTGLKKIHLKSKHPSITFAVTVSKATELRLTLLDKHGKKLAGWAKREGAGRHTLTLLLPARARHAGKDRLRITETGNPVTKTLTVAVAR